MRRLSIILTLAALLPLSAALAGPLQRVRPAQYLVPHRTVVQPAAVVIDGDTVEVIDTQLRNRRQVDTRLLGGLLKKFAAKRATREQRRLIRSFLAEDGNLDILAWQLENDPTVQWEPCPDTGKPLQDWLCTIVTNIDELIAAIEKIMKLFEGLQPPTPEPVGLTLPLWSDRAA